MRDREIAGWRDAVRACHEAAQSLRLLDAGQSAPEAARNVDLSAKAVWEIGWRYVKQGLRVALYEISLFAWHCLGTRRIGDLPLLAKEARAWNERVNQNRVMIDWTFDRKKTREKFHYKIKRSRY